jgi:hypothetical protein
MVTMVHLCCQDDIFGLARRNAVKTVAGLGFAATVVASIFWLQYAYVTTLSLVVSGTDGGGGGGGRRRLGWSVRSLACEVVIIMMVVSVVVIV